jgi:hypothetical protein
MIVFRNHEVINTCPLLTSCVCVRTEPRDDRSSTLFWSALPSNLQYPVAADSGILRTVSLDPADPGCRLRTVSLDPAEPGCRQTVRLANPFAALVAWLKQIADQSDYYCLMSQEQECTMNSLISV